jgi:hypothetical protein
VSVPQRPVLLQNLGGAGLQGRFADVTDRARAYFRAVHRARGLAVGELNNDGRPDLVISHVNEPATLLRNEAVPDRKWLGVVLRGKGRRDVVGAKFTLEAGGRKLTRFAKAGGSYLSSGDRRMLFGLGGADRVGRLTVVWPSGETQHRDGLGAGRYWELAKGEPEGHEWPPPTPKTGSDR